MARLSTKKNTKTTKKVAKTPAPAAAGLKGDYNHFILRPRITEKATFAAEHNVYTFEVSPRSDKKTVVAAVQSLYKVTPIDVRFVKIPGKTVMSRGKVGRRSGGRKAYVVLRKGDKIEIA